MTEILRNIENFDKYELITGINKQLALKIVFKNIPKDILAEYIVNYCTNDNIFKVLNLCFENYELQTFIYNNKNVDDNYLFNLSTNEEGENIKPSKFNRLKFCTRLQKNKCINIFKDKITLEEIKNFIIESTSNDKFEKIFERIFTTSRLKTILLVQSLTEEDYTLLYENLQNNKNNSSLNAIDKQEHTILDNNDENEELNKDDNINEVEHVKKIRDVKKKSKSLKK